MNNRFDHIPERTHSITDALTMLTVLVSKQPNGQVHITKEDLQDFGDYQLFLESSLDTSTISLSVRKRKYL